MQGQLGKKLGQFGFNKVNFIGLCVCALIFLGFGAFVLTLMDMPTSPEAAQGGSYYTGDTDPALLFGGVGAALLLLGVGALAIAFVQRAKYTYTLYENGIECKYKGNTYTDLFANIEDVYLYSIGRPAFTGVSNCLAYRAEGQTEWRVISPKNGGYAKLIRQFRQRHTAQRAPVLAARMQAGAPAVFSYQSAKSVWLKRAFGTKQADFVKLAGKLQQMALHMGALVYEGQTIPLAPTDQIKTNGWTEGLTLVDGAGNKKFGRMFFSILSPDVFAELLAYGRGGPR